MNHDFVTVDMRGLKAALVARARSDRTTVSTVVRAAVMHELGLVDAGEQGPSMATFPSAASVKLSIRMTRDEVARLDAGARAAGLSRAAYLAGLMDNVPVLMGGNRAESITALVASSVIRLFESSLEQMVALAILMPIVASMGGNAGTQTMTVAVRAPPSVSSGAPKVTP